MDLNLVSQLATTISVVISTLTLLSAYGLYRMGKKDSYVKELRNTLISYQYNSERLNSLVTFDISHELVHTVLNSRQVDRLLNSIFDEFFVANKSKEELKTYLDEIYPITVSIHTELLSQYEEILKTNSQLASRIYTDFPSLYRVYEVVNTIFNETIEVSKQLVRDEDIFRNAVLEAYDIKESLSTIDLFKENIFFSFLGLIQTKHSEHDQKDINDVLILLRTTSNGLMRLNDNKIIKLKKKEQKISYKESDKTETIFEDLLEAEKGLKMTLREDELLIFREYSTKIKVRNEELKN
jgi:hypothetical protein